jgi:hypothetical protein
MRPQEIAGPTLGGVITERFTWRWIFFVNLPLGVAGVATTLRLLQERPAARGRFTLCRFDIPGVMLLAAGLAALTLGLSFGREWSSPRARAR